MTIVDERSLFLKKVLAQKTIWIPRSYKTNSVKACSTYNVSLTRKLVGR